jgi:heme exporter protein C
MTLTASGPPPVDLRTVPLPAHMAVGWALVLATLALVGFRVPAADMKIGESYLIFFFHFPSAINCLNLFFFAGLASIYHLWRHTPGSDLWAASAVEVGILACTVTLVTGSIWAKAAWGEWWVVSDPRLMSVAIMFLTYLGYVALRSAVEEPLKRARFSAVFGSIAMLNIFVVYFSVRVFPVENHPMKVELADPSMRLTQWLGAGAFLVLYTAIWRLRFRLLRAHEEVERLDVEISAVRP